MTNCKHTWTAAHLIALTNVRCRMEKHLDEVLGNHSVILCNLETFTSFDP